MVLSCPSRLNIALLRARLVLVLADELDAVRAVDGERVDPEPLERLQDRLAGAAEEGDALMDLALRRRVLQEHDVPEGVTAA